MEERNRPAEKPVICHEDMGAGVRFHAVHAEHFKTDLLYFSFILPLKRETLADTALLPMVLTRGCRKYPTTEALAMALDDLYDMELSAKTLTRADTRILYLSKKNLERECVPGGEDLFLAGNALLSSVLFEPLLVDGGFSPQFTETERTNLIRSIRSSEKNKAAYASLLCRGGLWGNDVRGCYLNEDAVSAVTPQSLYRCYRELLEEASVECWYSGKRDFAETADAVRALLSPLFAIRKGKTSFAPFPEAKGPERERGVRYIRRDVPTEQSLLCVGHTTDILRGSVDYLAMVIFEELFGGGQSSMLFRSLRERAGLCYDCSSVYDKQSGALAVFCGIDAKNRTKAERMITEVLADACRGGFTEDDLTAAKRSVITSVRMRADHPAALCGWYASCVTDGLMPDTDAELKALSAVMREDVMRAAQAVKKRVSVFIRGTGRGGDTEPEEDGYDGGTENL